MLDSREVKISNNANGIYLKRFMIKEKNDKVISPKKAIGKCPNRKVKRTVIKKTLYVANFKIHKNLLCTSRDSILVS
jgi:hypothetical protein